MIDGPRLAPLSGGRPDALVVLVHGYGSNGNDLISLAAMIQPSLPRAAFVAPNAPSQLPGLAAAYQWWPIETFSLAERAAGVVAAAPVLDDFLTNELETAGVSDDRLLLVGFSQGTMMALHVGLRRQHAVAGIVGLSGMLISPDLVAAELRSRPPILLIHGTQDEIVPFGAMDQAARALAGAGLSVETHACAGVGHSVDHEGLAAATAFAQRALT